MVPLIIAFWLNNNALEISETTFLKFKIGSRISFKKYIINRNVLEIQLNQLLGNLDVSLDPKSACLDLTEYERWILSQIFFSGYTVNELSKTLRKSRQSVNQVKKRALDKLKIVI